MSSELRLSAPFFVIGAPRSGTTFLREVLNRHERVLITNELRVMTYMNRIINRTASDKWILLNGREGFLEHFKRELPLVIESYYRGLGASSTTRWGDKNPHYADSKTDPECLALIDELFPESQFLNIVRDGREVVSSLIAKGWVDLDEAVAVWRRHIEHARDFGRKISADRFLTVKYEDLVAEPFAITSRVFTFLDVGEDQNVTDFLAKQARERTPFSKPMSDTVGAPAKTPRLTSAEHNRVSSELGDLLAELGYVA